MSGSSEVLVQVRCAWNAWRTAEVRVADLRDIHWLQPAGAPRPLLHAYVDCNKLVSGQISHDCGGTSRPHKLLICVLKRSAVPQTYGELSQIADHQPRVRSDVTPSLLSSGGASRRDAWGTAHVGTPSRGSSHV
jgi:hypothetical protein